MTHDPARLRQLAIVVSTLDLASADRLLERFSSEEQTRIRNLMVELDAVDPREEEAALAEFLRHTSARPSAAPTASAPPRRETPPPASDDLVGGIPSRFLEQAESHKLVPLLEREHPQTIAVVVAHLPEAKAAGVLAALESCLQAEVIERLVHLDDAHPEMIREVERGLQTRIVEQVRDTFRHQQGLSVVARILSAAPPLQRAQVLANVARRDPRLAEELAPAEALEFADLENLPEDIWRAWLAQVDDELLGLALLGASPGFTARVLRSLSPAASSALRQSLDRPGTLRLSDVEDAQQELVRAAEGITHGTWVAAA